MAADGPVDGVLHPSGARRRSGSVLILDDNALLAEALRRVLARHHDVVIATDGAQALTHVSSGRHFDVVLCDVEMPTMDGIAFYERLAEMAPAVTERVVFMSGGARGDRVEAFFRRVPNLRLGKPLDPLELLTLIEQFTGRPGSHRPTAAPSRG
jgi:CheY-like chemotaxis protein